jgi:hypothetical protein
MEDLAKKTATLSPLMVVISPRANVSKIGYDTRTSLHTRLICLDCSPTSTTNNIMVLFHEALWSPEQLDSAKRLLPEGLAVIIQANNTPFLTRKFDLTSTKALRVLRYTRSARSRV